MISTPAQPESTPKQPDETMRSIFASLIMDNWQVWVSAISAILLSILIGSIFLILNGYSPLEAYKNILIGAFGNKYAIGETLLKTTPLIFTGLAVAIAFQAGLFNIGGEGQLIIGALMTAMIGQMNLGLPTWLHLPIAILGGFLGGAAYGGLAGFIKVRFGAHEVIVTIMLNYIAFLLTSYMVNYPWKAEGMVPQTNPILPTAQLARLIQGSQLNTGIFIGLLVTFLVSVMFKKTILGFEMRAVGFNSPASLAAGIHAAWISVVAMMIAGGVAGIGGGVEVLGVHGRFIQGFSPGFGYDGVAVAILANNNPVLIPLTALLFGVLRAGGAYLERNTAIPGDFALVIQGLVILFAASPRIFSAILKRR
jgi:ABC-type uncharacterized transport system permease subunit